MADIIPINRKKDREEFKKKLIALRLKSLLAQRARALLNAEPPTEEEHSSDSDQS